MRTLLIFLWCLPQNIIGLFVLIFTKLQGAKSKTFNGTLVTRWKYSTGVSLGQFIFVPTYAGNNIIWHEWGHYKSGLFMGWLYLFIVGLPSIIWCGCFDNYRKKHDISYYSFYTERMADYFGGIIRY